MHYLEHIHAYQLAESINLLEVTRVHTNNSNSQSHNCKKILLINAIEGKANVSTGSSGDI